MEAIPEKNLLSDLNFLIDKEAEKIQKAKELRIIEELRLKKLDEEQGKIFQVEEDKQQKLLDKLPKNDKCAKCEKKCKQYNFVKIRQCYKSEVKKDWNLPIIDKKKKTFSLLGEEEIKIYPLLNLSQNNQRRISHASRNSSKKNSN